MYVHVIVHISVGLIYSVPELYYMPGDSVAAPLSINTWFCLNTTDIINNMVINP